MSDSVQTDFVANDKEMLAAYRRMQKEVEKYKKMVGEAGQQHKKEADEAEQAAKKKIKAQQEWLAKVKSVEAERAAAEKHTADEGKRLTDSLRTSKEKLADQLKRISALQAAGAISATTANRASAAAYAESTKHIKATKSSIEEAQGAIAGYAAGFVSVGAAVQIATRLYAAWDAEIKRVTESHKTATAEIVKTLGAGMDLKQAPHIQKTLSGINLSPADAAKAFASATAAAPGMDVNRRLAIVRESAPLAAMGQDVAANAEVGTKLANLDATMSPQKAANLAAMMRARAGEDAGKIGSDEFMSGAAKLKAAGLSTEMALAISQAGVEADLPSKAAKSIAEALSESDPTAGQRGRLSAADKAKREFYKQGAAGRWAALQDKATAESVLGAGGSLNVAVMGDAMAQMGAMGKPEGFIAGRQAEMNKWGEGRQFGADVETATMRAKKDAEEGGPWSKAETVRNRISEMHRARGVGAFARWKLDLDRKAEAGINAMAGIDPLTSVEQSINRVIRTQQESSPYTLDKAQQKEIAELIKALRENTVATQQNTPKAKKNIDGQNERNP